MEDESKLNSSPLKYDEILQAYKQENYRECINLINEVTGKLSNGYNGHVQYQILKCSCMIQLEEHVQDVHEILNKILKDDNENVFAIYAKGLAYFTEDNYVESIEMFNKVLELDPSPTMVRARMKMREAEGILRIKNRSHISKRELPSTEEENTKESDDSFLVENVREINRIYRCEICSGCFKKKFNLDRHTISIHGFDKSEIQKEKSIRQSKKKRKLNKILGGTTPNEFFSQFMDKEQVACDKCDRICSNKFSLKRHMKIHLNNRPFKCSKCDYRFIQMYDLRRHEDTHSQTMSYSCKKCDVCFKTKRSKQSHNLKWHRNE